MTLNSVLETLAPGAYTAIVSGSGGPTGVALVNLSVSITGILTAK